MKVSELIELLKGLPPEAEIQIASGDGSVQPIAEVSSADPDQPLIRGGGCG
jgi:hypothetical protein